MSIRLAYRARLQERSPRRALDYGRRGPLQGLRVHAADPELKARRMLVDRRELSGAQRNLTGKQHAVALSLGTVPVVTNDNRHAERKVLEDAMVNLGLRPLALGVETNPFCTRPIEGSTSCSLWLPTTGALIYPRQEDGNLALSPFDGDYDSYEGAMADELASLPPVAMQAFGWGVCEHLLQVLELLGRAAQFPATQQIRSTLDDAWRQVSGGSLATPDAAIIEELMPVDEAGVGQGGPGVGELNDLGLCVALVSEAATAGPDSVAQAASTALSALADYDDIDLLEADSQEGLLERLREGDLSEVRQWAEMSGREIAERVQAFLGQ